MRQLIAKVGTLWILFLGLAVGCAQFNPIARADTTQQKALAAYGSLVIGVEQISELLRPDTLPDNVQERLIALAERSAALASAGLAAYNQAEEARADFAADVAAEGRLTAALNNLDGWVTRAEPVVNDLKAAIRGAQ
jgi:hypothetical protein